MEIIDSSIMKIGKSINNRASYRAPAKLKYIAADDPSLGGLVWNGAGPRETLITAL